ncbi:Fic family protein [Luteimicrobium album]|uniref:Fic family protein n=1 Tax=Luteimicrobium album TaxID=1054550 RepID=A0ABQ6I4Q4_9MICO|nr:Fic family protein [Luteimicrobium album]GMA25738.1 Fic family protein [Luteimicrobium album]
MALVERSSWPPLSYEELEWTVSDDIRAQVDVFQARRMQQPYRAAITPSIADTDPVSALSRETMALVRFTSASLTRFDQDMANVPVAMPAILLRSESASSSQIEKLSSSARSIAAAQLGLSDERNAMEIAANTDAMWQAVAIEESLDVATICSIHHTLMARTEPDIAGRLRQQQVWVGGGASLSPHGADYVAPAWEKVRGALEDMAAFAARADVPGIVLASVVHAQFESIHPFEDGNGRTGRAIIHPLLRASGLATHTIVPVSAGLLGDVPCYFAALDSYRSGDLNPIVARVCAGAQSAIVGGRALAAEIQEVRESWTTSIHARSDSSAWRLADELFRQPVVNAAYAASRLDVSDRAARNAIETLVTADALTPVTLARRNQAWQAPKILAAMDHFAETSTRRR